MLLATLLQIGESFREFRLELLSEFHRVAVGPFDMILKVQKDRAVPVPPRKQTGTLEQPMRTAVRTGKWTFAALLTFPASAVFDHSHCPCIALRWTT